MVILPYGYSIWENMVAEMDRLIKLTGAENAYFPLFIPQSYLTREADHVEGFAPELAVVTHGGGKELDEPVIVRPTSETVIAEFMAKKISSYRDLPLLWNAWNNVVRWELRPRLFLRSSEFLWQEGHTAHADKQDARNYAQRIFRECYEAFMHDHLAIPVFSGNKSPRERFPGAINTMTVEGMMRDAKALQLGTSHELGQNFAKAFDIFFTDSTGTQQLAWTTSWGVSTRMVGGLIMTHGDDFGLRIPPRVAPIQVVVSVVKESPEVIATCAALTEELKALGVRVKLDGRTDLSFGRRAVDWEIKGVPIRLEVGPRDLENQQVTITRRDTRQKTLSPVGEATRSVLSALETMQIAMYNEALAHRDANTHDVSTADEAQEAAATGFARIRWGALGIEGENALREKAITVRCLHLPDGTLADDENDPEQIAILARAY